MENSSEKTKHVKWRPPPPNFPNYKPKPSSNPTAKKQKTTKTLILFLHGFMGSDMSFGSFPSDIIQTLSQRYNLNNVETQIYPKFETKGDHRQIVAQLAAWLETNVRCTGMPRDIDDVSVDEETILEVEYDGVIILGHSMGGIFAVDAYCAMAGLIGSDGKPVSRSDLKREYEESKKPKLSKDEKLKKIVSKYTKLNSFEKDNMEIDNPVTTQNETNPLNVDDDLTPRDTTETKLSSIEPYNRNIVTTNNPKSTGSISKGAAWLGVAGLSYMMGARSTASQIVKETVVEAGKSTISATISGAKSISNSIMSSLQSSQPGIYTKCTLKLIINFVILETSEPPELSHNCEDVNIFGILAFDSPFYSVHPRVITVTAGSKAASTVTSYIPPVPKAVKELPTNIGVGMNTASSTLKGGVLAVSKTLSDGVVTASKVVGSGINVASGVVSSGAKVVVESTRTVREWNPRKKGDTAEKGHPEGSYKEESHLVDGNPEQGLIQPENQPVESSMIEEPKILQAENKPQIEALGDAPNIQELSKDELMTFKPNPEDRLDTLVEQIEIAASHEQLNKQESSASPNETQSETNRNEWYPWLAIGLTAAAVGGAAYYTGGLSLAIPFVQRTAVLLAISNANLVRKYLQFLSPVWSASTKELQNRLRAVMDDVEQNYVGFKGIYVELPPLQSNVKDNKGDDVLFEFNGTSSETESTNLNTSKQTIKSSGKLTDIEKQHKKIIEQIAKDETEDEALNANFPTFLPQSTDMPRTFCCHPPPEFESLFGKIGSDCNDEISAHMHMFDRAVNSGYYWVLVEEVAKECATWITEGRHRLKEKLGK
ncbi:hypothetical protein HK098_005495 [Nowakowskiella sp. JEL0407]|nr:hypothetical protein HK098_005495 [Nowakowskiella sp. JEL0407]